MNANSKLKEAVKERLSPDERWQLSRIIENLLRRKINDFPKRKVTEEETRYPSDFPSMRAFMETFFARHYFQVQDSLIDYITSDDFINIYNSGRLNILDIGSGPAVASLAIIDMLKCAIECSGQKHHLKKLENAQINIVLNDIVKVSLGTGKELLKSYFISGKCNLSNKAILLLDKEFPSNINQLKRIASNYGNFDLVILSYVIIPLSEEDNIRKIACSIKEVESICRENGKILIIQDRFRQKFMNKLTNAIGKEYKKEELTQQVYSPDNSNEYHKYKYLSCLFSPKERVSEKNNIEVFTR